MHEREKYVTCEICSNEEIKEEMETFKERVGRTYKYILDLKTFEQIEFEAKSGEDMFICPYNDQE